MGLHSALRPLEMGGSYLGLVKIDACKVPHQGQHAVQTEEQRPASYHPGWPPAAPQRVKFLCLGLEPKDSGDQKKFSAAKKANARIVAELYASDKPGCSTNRLNPAHVTRSDGEIYLELRQLTRANQQDARESLLSELTNAKIKNFRRLCSPNNEWFSKCLEKLEAFPGLFQDHRREFSLGRLTRAFRYKCHEEIETYLHTCYEIWNYIAGNDDTVRSAVDEATVESLRGLCPSSSLENQETIRDLFQKRKIFHSVTDEAERDAIQGRVLSLRRMILTMGTFFAHLKYMGFFDALLGVLMPRNVSCHLSTRRKLNMVFTPAEDGTSYPVLSLDHGFVPKDVEPKHQLLCGYMQLVLATWRDELDAGSKPNCPSCEKPYDYSTHTSSFLQMAKALGFNFSTSVTKGQCEKELPIQNTIKPSRPKSSQNSSARPSGFNQAKERLFKTSKAALDLFKVNSEHDGEIREHTSSFEILRQIFFAFFGSIPLWTGYLDQFGLECGYGKDGKDKDLEEIVGNYAIEIHNKIPTHANILSPGEFKGGTKSYAEQHGHAFPYPKTYESLRDQSSKVHDAAALSETSLHIQTSHGPVRQTKYDFHTARRQSEPVDFDKPYCPPLNLQVADSLDGAHTGSYICNILEKPSHNAAAVYPKATAREAKEVPVSPRSLLHPHPRQGVRPGCKMAIRRYKEQNIDNIMTVVRYLDDHCKNGMFAFIKLETGQCVVLPTNHCNRDVVDSLIKPKRNGGSQAWAVIRESGRINTIVPVYSLDNWSWKYPRVIFLIDQGEGGQHVISCKLEKAILRAKNK